MKNKQEIVDALEFYIRETEHAYLKAQDVLAETLDYVRSSRDGWAEIVEQDAYWNSPEGIAERKKHEEKMKEKENAECR